MKKKRKGEKENERNERKRKKINEKKREKSKRNIKQEKQKIYVTIQVIVNGAPLSAAIIPSKTSNPFFLIVEM